MSLFDTINGFPRDVVTIHATLKLNRKLYQRTQEEARQQGITVERYIALVVEEKVKEKS